MRKHGEISAAVRELDARSSSMLAVRDAAQQLTTALGRVVSSQAVSAARARARHLRAPGRFGRPPVAGACRVVRLPAAVDAEVIDRAARAGVAPATVIEAIVVAALGHGEKRRPPCPGRKTQ